MLNDQVPNAEIPITFGAHLQEMPSSLIWNVYKHLTQELLKHTVEVPYKDVMQNMRDKVL